MLKRYEKYKPSHVLWIGDMPEHWKVKKLKYATSINDEVLPETTEKNIEIKYADISSVQQGRIVTMEKYRFGDAPSRARRKVKDGDVIVSTVRTYLKAIARIKAPDNNLIVSTGFAVVRPKNLYSGFLGNLFYSENLIGEIICRSVGVSYPAINASEIGDIYVPIPPTKEQAAIANYLDKKTTQIDSFIGNKKQLIELLKEEKTAIINEAISGKRKNCGRIRLKYLVTKVGSGVTPTGGANVYLQEGIPLLRSQNIYSDGLVLDDLVFISGVIDEQMSNSRIQEGDVLLNITGASIGRCYFVPIGFGNGNVNQHVCIIRPIQEKIKTEFLHMFLISDFGQTLIDICQNGANREGLNFQQIKSFEIPLPKISEQKELLQHIQSETLEIDNIISKIETEIKLIQEYKAVLINEVVTGKIKVI